MLKSLSGLRGGFVLLPVTWMVFAPQLDAADLVGSAEVVAITVLAQPSTLAGALTGFAASCAGTVVLAILGPRIGNEELGATAAFASGLSTAHRKPHLGERPTERKPKRRTARK